ncbi:MAG: DUF4349 domain-containing protein [Candidatus Paceibacterota bacterium]|jgi:hypothetical protein
MSDEILRKFKKALLISVITVAGMTVFLVVIFASLYFFGNSTNRKTGTLSMPSSAPMFLGRGSTFIGEDGMKGGEGAYDPIAPDSVQNADTDGQGNTESPIIERKLIQEGDLSLVVKQVEDAILSLKEVAKNLGGLADDIHYSNVQNNDKKRATVTLRVPAVNFDMAMAQAKEIAVKVESENISTRNVTHQFIDMQARLKNLKAQEEQYQDIMKKAVKVSDILEVSQYLYNTRQQIEVLQGDMNYLSRQVDMSVITITLSSEPDIEATNVIWSPMTTAKEAIRHFITAFYRFVDALIWGTLSFLPLTVIFGGCIFFLAWLFMKVLRPWYAAIKAFFHS